MSDDQKMTEAVEAIRSMTTYRLASEAGCASPDRTDSAGAEFLGLVRDAVLEAWDDIDVDDRAGAEASDLAHEAADGCVPIYTRDVWATFVDLAAYQEDPSEFGTVLDADHDMERAAMTCLYMIGYRLAYFLAEMLIDEAGEAGEAGDEDEEADQ